MVSSTVAPTAAAAAAVSATAVAAIASSVGSAAAALCLLAEWRLCASAIGCAMAVLLHSHLLAHTLYSERRTAAATAPPPAVPHSATAVSSHNYSAAAIVSLLG